MTTEERLKSLQRIYIAFYADTIKQYGDEGILEKVTAQKREQQLLNAKSMVAQFGAATVKDIFQNVREIFNCANWEVCETQNETVATATGCPLCVYAKKIGTQNPCDIFCLNPLEAMVKGLDEELSFKVSETLWDGKQCIISIKKYESN